MINCIKKAKVVKATPATIIKAMESMKTLSELKASDIPCDVEYKGWKFRVTTDKSHYGKLYKIKLKIATSNRVEKTPGKLGPVKYKLSIGRPSTLLELKNEIKGLIEVFGELPVEVKKTRTKCKCGKYAAR